jgi:RNA polymerase sigma factor (sigma-70 family)
MNSKIDFDTNYFDHLDYHNNDEVDRILSYTIGENDYDRRYSTANTGLLQDIIKNYPILKRDSTYNLFIKYNLLKKLQSEGQDLKDEIKELKNSIICHNIRLIPHALKTFTDREDYFSQAYVTLDRCVDRFNPNLGFAFNTYTSNSIFRNCIRSKQEENSKSGMTFSISDSEQFLVDGKNKDITKIDSDDLVNFVNSIVNRLGIKERDVMVRSFGLFGSERETLEQIASRYGVSKERIRQIKDKTLRKCSIELGVMPVLAECI